MYTKFMQELTIAKDTYHARMLEAEANLQEAKSHVSSLKGQLQRAEAAFTALRGEVGGLK